MKAAGEEVDRGGAALLDLDRIDTTLLDPRLASTTVVLACDVDNPLVGAQGAATVDGPQKGATSDDVELLDRALSHYAEVVHATWASRAVGITRARALLELEPDNVLAQRDAAVLLARLPSRSGPACDSGSTEPA